MLYRNLLIYLLAYLLIG